MTNAISSRENFKLGAKIVSAVTTAYIGHSLFDLALYEIRSQNLIPSALITASYISITAFSSAIGFAYASCLVNTFSSNQNTAHQQPLLNESQVSLV